jgi:hypothetical protein
MSCWFLSSLCRNTSILYRRFSSSNPWISYLDICLDGRCYKVLVRSARKLSSLWGGELLILSLLKILSFLHSTVRILFLSYSNYCCSVNSFCFFSCELIRLRPSPDYLMRGTPNRRLVRDCCFVSSFATSSSSSKMLAAIKGGFGAKCWDICPVL